MQRNYPMCKASSGINKVSVTTYSAPVPKGDTSNTNIGRNCLYVLDTHHQFEASPDVVTCML